MDEITMNGMPEVEETELEPIVELEVDPEPEVETTIGMVSGCTMLNVRDNPDKNADIVSILPVGTEVLVYTNCSTDDWFKVCTAAGIEGFCMKEFIELQQ